MKQLILATNNHHKVGELKFFLKDINVEVLTLREVASLPTPIEDGTSFQENALKKARAVYRGTHLPTLADDSGLEVFYLTGRPGLHSARYAGEPKDDDRNNEKLLAEMRGVAPRRRGAQFRAVLAFVGAGFEELTEGICPGSLAESPRGSNGFGYDPIFIPDGFARTYAELKQEEKNAISHRSRAFAHMEPILRKRIA